MYNKRSYKTNHERRKIKEVRIYTKKQKKYVSHSVRKSIHYGCNYQYIININFLNNAINLFFQIQNVMQNSLTVYRYSCCYSLNTKQT